jgi:hypothetical protein
MDAHLANIVVTELDPAIAWSWNEAALASFSAAVNAAAVAGALVPARPVWITAGIMSPNSFADDVVAYCAAAAGVPAPVNSVQGRVMISPNDVFQCARVLKRVGGVELSPFVQHFLPDGPYLADLYLIPDKTISSGQPCSLAPPEAPLKRVFA